MSESPAMFDRSLMPKALVDVDMPAYRGITGAVASPQPSPTQSLELGKHPSPSHSVSPVGHTPPSQSKGGGQGPGVTVSVAPSFAGEACTYGIVAAPKPPPNTDAATHTS